MARKQFETPVPQNLGQPEKNMHGLEQSEQIHNCR